MQIQNYTRENGKESLKIKNKAKLGTIYEESKVELETKIKELKKLRDEKKALQDIIDE